MKKIKDEPKGCCIENHGYVPVGNITEDKAGNSVQVVYCTKCGKRKEIVIAPKKK